MQTVYRTDNGTIWETVEEATLQEQLTKFRNTVYLRLIKGNRVDTNDRVSINDLLGELLFTDLLSIMNQFLTDIEWAKGDDVRDKISQKAWTFFK